MNEKVRWWIDKACDQLMPKGIGMCVYVKRGDIDHAETITLREACGFKALVNEKSLKTKKSEGG